MEKLVIIGVILFIILLLSSGIFFYSIYKKNDPLRDYSFLTVMVLNIIIQLINITYIILK